jgi:hypothetical protein
MIIKNKTGEKILQYSRYLYIVFAGILIVLAGILIVLSFIESDYTTAAFLFVTTFVLFVTIRYEALTNRERKLADKVLEDNKILDEIERNKRGKAKYDALDSDLKVVAKSSIPIGPKDFVLVLNERGIVELIAVLDKHGFEITKKG